MGTLDRTSYRFTCPQCGVIEKVTILDKGNQYSGSDWQSGPTLNNFNVTWDQDQYTEPQIASISCKNCHVEPEIESGYSL